MYRKFEGEADRSHHGPAPNRLYSTAHNMRTWISEGKVRVQIGVARAGRLVCHSPRFWSFHTLEAWMEGRGCLALVPWWWIAGIETRERFPSRISQHGMPGVWMMNWKLGPDAFGSWSHGVPKLCFFEISGHAP